MSRLCLLLSHFSKNTSKLFKNRLRGGGIISCMSSPQPRKILKFMKEKRNLHQYIGTILLFLRSQNTQYFSIFRLDITKNNYNLHRTLDSQKSVHDITTDYIMYVEDKNFRVQKLKDKFEQHYSLDTNPLFHASTVHNKIRMNL